ncbi:MAG: flagellar protein FlgN [Pirellulales bacterium]
MSVPWEAELVDLLSSLSAVQGELLELLDEKRELLISSDTEGLQALAGREEELIGRLETCHQRRQKLLQEADREGRPAHNIRSLTASLPRPVRRRLRQPITEARTQSSLLHHQSLANWVIVQRTLIHLSQMLEIIATGGRPEPTYQKDMRASHSSGALVDRAV